MGLKAEEALAAANSFTKVTVAGAGAIAGKPCQIQSIEDITDGKRVTFLWVDNNDTEHTSTMDVMNGEQGEDGEEGPAGRGIESSYVDEEEHFIIVYDDGDEQDCGKITAVIEEAVLAGDIYSNTAVGGISAGALIPEGTTFSEFVERLVTVEIAPTTTFTATGSGVKEVGTTVTTPTLTLVINTKGTASLKYVKFYDGNTLLDSQSVNPRQVIPATFTFTMEDVTSTKTVRAVLEYKKMDGTDATVEKSATYTFVMASYYGAVATAPTDKAGIIALTKNVKTTKAQTATFTLSNQRSCYCYPASFGNLTSIKDANNFEYLSSYTKTTVDVDGTSYNVYTLTDPVTATGFKQVYA